MRITNAMLVQTATHALSALKERVANAQLALASGETLQRPSDNPVAVVNALELASANRHAEAMERAAGGAMDWLGSADAALEQLAGALGAARDTAVATGRALDRDDRETLAQAVEHALAGARAAAASRYQGAYLFSGFRAETPPFAYDPVTGAATYQGDDNSPLPEVAPGIHMPTRVPGGALLQRGDFFAALQQLAADIRSGDLAAVNDRLAELDGALAQINTLRATVGLRQERCQQHMGAARQAQTDLQGRLALAVGAEMERTVLELTQQQAAYQAALAVTARLLPPGLLDHLR